MAQDAASCRTRPNEYLAKARCPSSECVSEPDLELTHIFAAREAGARGGSGEQQELHDATSPHRSVRPPRPPSAPRTGCGHGRRMHAARRLAGCSGGRASARMQH